MHGFKLPLYTIMSKALQRFRTEQMMALKLASVARVAPSLLPKALHLERKQSNASARLLAGVIATLVTQSLLLLRRFDQHRLILFRWRRGSLRGKVTRPHRGGPLLAQD
jgi:hypothetical protein